MEKAVAEHFHVQLEKFKPHAAYYEDMDYIEYVTADVITVAERVDPFLTILWDKNQDKVIGFKLKGFRNYFENIFKPLYDLNNDEFVQLASAIEHLYTIEGITIVRQLQDEKSRDRNRQAYRRAMELAANQNVRLYQKPEIMVKAA